MATAKKPRVKANKAVNTKPSTAGPVKTVPVAKTKQVFAKGPVMKTNANGGWETSRRELITTIKNSTTYQVNGGVSGLVYRMNPTFGSTLTWLPSVASCFDMYIFRKLELEFVPLTGTQEKGRVALWFDKDSEDAPPADRVELASMGVLAETAPWDPITLRIPTDNVARFCLGTGSNTDAKMIDLGQVGYSTYSGSSTDEIGDLFAVYTVELFYPQPASSLVQTLSIDANLARTVEVGPIYFNTSRTSTVNDTKFSTPGTFIVVVAGRATTYASEAAIGSAVINSPTVTSSSSGFTGVYNVTCTRAGDGLRINGTGFTGSMTTAVRARIANAVTPPI